MSTVVYEAEPHAAAGLFGEHIDAARQYTRDLARRGEELGLIGPLELPRLWTRHVVNSALVAALVWPNALVGDIGSGAGLPGLVLAIARPDAQFVLIEPMERRCDWLRHEAAELGLANVEVMRVRAEDAEPAPLLDQATARAVSALSKLLPLTVPLVRSGGEVILMKGASVEAEVAAAAKAIKRLRLTDCETLVLGDGAATEVTRVFRATVD
ncbi:16S rRNA (guanine(527)-N(7))-methyltransferase RsmG [Marisediminicola sp. UYEF4]|uniref:16S rRNA (guanine(527)-N(7))-methyltransferase RsmG n=1 Tax=Marisediminicola sp. UYEF4 TaxID=1756384 RepID=UPI003392E3DA